MLALFLFIAIGKVGAYVRGVGINCMTEAVFRESEK